MKSCVRDARIGATLVETLVALLLGLALMHLALSATRRARAAHAVLTSRAEALAAFRLTAAVLRTELGAGVAEHDWRLEGETLVVRAFRGTGLVCQERGAPDELLVSYSGYRSPDPAKDSLLVISSDGVTHVTGLLGTGVGATSCNGSALERPLVLRPADPLLRPVLVRVFEHGAYTVAAAALRYERGASGRQPLTPEVWSRGSRLIGDGDGLRVRLVDAAGRSWDLFLALRGGG